MTTSERLERFQNYIGGKFVDASDGRTFDSLDPYAGASWAAIPEGSDRATSTTPSPPPAARCRASGARMTGFQRGALHAQARRPDHGERRAAGPGRGARQRQAVPGDDRPAAGAGRLVPLLRRARGQDRGPGHPDRQAQLLLLHPPRAGRRGRRDHAVELPAAADDVQARPGARRGLHVRGQAVRALARVDAGLRAGAARGGVPGRRRSTSSRDPAGSSAPHLAGHKGVDKVAFTGSTATGRAVAHAAADNLNRVTLELGGKSPQIVFEDADLAAAANGIIAGVFAATGQTCMAGLARDRARERPRRAGPRWSPSGRTRSSSATRTIRTPRWARSRTSRSTRRCSATSTSPRRRARRRRAAARRPTSWAGSSSSRRCSPGPEPTTRWCARRSSARSPWR